MKDKYYIHEVKSALLSVYQIQDRFMKDFTWDRLSPCECGSKSYILLPEYSKCVQEGGKNYLICMHCGGAGMHL